MDGEKRLSNITMIEIVCFLMGKQKFQRGNSRKHGGESFQFQTWRGKQIFSAGLPSTLAGQCFSGVVTGGV